MLLSTLLLNGQSPDLHRQAALLSNSSTPSNPGRAITPPRTYCTIGLSEARLSDQAVFAVGPCGFDLGGGAHSERGVPASGVVEHDVVVDRVALASSIRVFQRRRLNSSTCRRPQKLSIIALSAAVPTAPIEGTIFAVRTRSLNAQEVNCPNSTGPRNSVLVR